MTSVEICDGPTGIRRIALNRPDKLNALTVEMRVKILEAVESCNVDDAIRVIVISGNGTSFSAGHDISVPPLAGSVGTSSLDGHLARDVQLARSLWDCPVPVIAQVHGYCLGIATVLVNCCDLVYVSEDAAIGWPVLTLGGGLIGPSWMVYVGVHRAREYEYLAGSRIDGVTAANLGWANSSYPLRELPSQVSVVAERLCRVPRDLLRIKKLALNQALGVGDPMEILRQGLAWEAEAHEASGVAELRELANRYGRRAVADWQCGGEAPAWEPNSGIEECSNG